MMLIEEKEEAINDAERAVATLTIDSNLQRMLDDGFVGLGQGQEEILNQIDQIDLRLQEIGTSVHHLSEMTAEGFRQVLKVLEPSSGKKAPGELRVVQVRVTQSEEEKAGSIDFWVTNDDGSQVIITAVQFKVIDTARAELIRGAMKASCSYDLDISDLQKAEQVASCPVSQEVEPGKSDRFRVVLKADRLGTGVFGAWKLRPSLMTNYGDIEAETIEVWLPYKEDLNFEDLKGVEAMIKRHSGTG